MNDLEELLNNIYIDIRTKNSERSPYSIPLSDEIYEQNARKYNLLPFSVPSLFKVLVDSHKLFQFKIVEADRTERIRKIDGFVVTEGNIIKSLIEIFSDELIREFSNEFSKRYTIDKIIRELVPKINEYNNTSLGKAANILINLLSFQSLLERNIMQYGAKWQEKQLKAELEKCGPIENFIDIAASAPDIKEIKSEAARPQADAQDKQSLERAKLRDFKAYSNKDSLEKTLTVYGVEFYTRVCFRDKQYVLVKKLVEDGVIKDKDDLVAIKKLLQKERQSSDTNAEIQKYAGEINNLEKSINLILKG